MEEELKPYLIDGYLNKENRFKFLRDKGIIRLVRGEPVILADKGAEYMRMQDNIDICLKEITRKIKGKPVDIEQVETQVNKFNKSHDEITADEVDF